MTLGKAIEIFDSERSNSVDMDKKVRWISQLDYKINLEITRPRGDEAFGGYDASTPLITVLKAPEEFGEIYSLYLNMKLDYMNGEIARFNNSALLFNNMYRDMNNYMNRKQAVLNQADIKAGDIYV